MFLPVRAHGQAGEELIQPKEIRSRNGVLDAALTAAPGTVRLGNFTFPGALYNGSYLPPLLRARTGDVHTRLVKRGDEVLQRGALAGPWPESTCFDCLSPTKSAPGAPMLLS
jgi:hypothetical protein